VEKVRSWWEEIREKGRNKMHTFQLKLKEPKSKISIWNKKEFGHILEEKQLLEV